MASLNFPSLPAVNQSHSQAGRTWKWNGEAWDLQSTIDASTIVNSVCGATGHVYPVCSLNGFTGSVSITGGNQITVSNSGNVITIDTIEGAQSDLDADLLGGISYKRFHEDLKTGILYGGILSINGASAAQFDITGGKGLIVDVNGSTYAYPNPTVTEVSWNSMTGVTLTNLATADTTWLHIDSSGVLQQMTTPFSDTPELSETGIMIGALIHPNHTTITLAKTFPTTSYNSELQSEIFIRSFGGLKMSGHTIQPNGANLQLNRTSGKAFAIGRNYVNDPDLSCVISDAAKTDATFYRYYRNGSGGFTTVINQTAIDPANYDDGSGTLASVSTQKWTIQRIFFFPGTPDILGVYYGRAVYNSQSEALSNLATEDFSEITNTQHQAVYCATMIVRGGASDLSDSSHAKIIQAGLFRSTTSGGGGSVSVAFDDLNDVTITSPATNELVYYSGTEWVNTAITNLPLVRSFNGNTGAVQGVSAAVAGTGISVSGATGSVTISNLGVLSVSGTTPISAATDENNAVSVSHATSGVIAASYGSATAVPVVTVNSTGHLTGVSNTNIAITSSAVSDFNEAAQDTTASMITSGTHSFVTTSYDDGAGTLSITNTGVQSFNGSTGAIQGVSSVNGATGAITNVAKTDVANTFQISAANILAIASTNVRSYVDFRVDGATNLMSTTTANGTMNLNGAVNVGINTLTETIEDAAASLITSGTHQGLSAAYVDASNRIDLSVYPFHIGYMTNTASTKYYHSLGLMSTANGISNSVLNRLHLSVFHIPVTMTLDTVGWRTSSTANASGTSFKMGLYNHNYATGTPTTLFSTLTSGASVPTSANTDVEITSLALTVPAGMYWMGIIFDATTNTRYFNSNELKYMFGWADTTTTSAHRGLWYDVGSYTLSSDLSAVTFNNETFNRLPNMYIKI